MVRDLLAAPWRPGQGWSTVIPTEPNNLATLVGPRQWFCRDVTPSTGSVISLKETLFGF